MKPTKEQICTLLDAWIRQRPGLDFRNYCSGWQDKDGRAAYRAEVRSIGRDLQDARQLLRAVALSGITGEDLAAAFPRAYSGRLTLEEVPGKLGAFRLDYCTGQYWPTEYRRAACSVLAAALWDYYRDDFAKSAKPGESAGDSIRRNFRRQYGRRLASSWFD